MLFCYSKACRSLTARTEHHTLSVIFIKFLKPSSGIDTEGKKIIIIRVNVERWQLDQMFPVSHSSVVRMLLARVSCHVSCDR